MAIHKHSNVQIFRISKWISPMWDKKKNKKSLFFSKYINMYFSEMLQIFVSLSRLDYKHGSMWGVGEKGNPQQGLLSAWNPDGTRFQQNSF